MESQVLTREASVPMKQILKVESLLRQHGFQKYTICHGCKTATVMFHDDNEYLIFVLKDIIGLAKRSGLNKIQPDFSFMIRLEKQMKSYSQADEYFIRRALKDT
jgi:hypothetical protein